MVSSGPIPQDLLELGRVAGAYGVHGWIRVHAHTEGSTTLLSTKAWWFKSPASVSAGAGEFRCLPILRVREHGTGLVACVESIEDRTEALALKGHTIWVSRSEFPPADADEIYWADLVGCQLHGETQAGESVLLGEVTHVSDNGAHALLHVCRMLTLIDGSLAPELDAKGRRRVSLVPFVAAHVHTVDLDKRQLFSNWPADF